MSKSPPKYSDKLIDEYRYVYADFDDWYHCICDDFKERMDAIGIDVDKIYFSGFCSQGDGACFQGSVKDWGKYLAHLGYTDPILIDTAEQTWTYRWEQTGRYYHHKSVAHDNGIYLPDNPYIHRSLVEDDEFRAAVWDVAMAQHDLLALSEQIQEDLEDHMQDLYRKLEEEHDYLTSDEAIIEWMEANDIDPDELTDKD